MKHIYAIGGGKGGSGKSFLVANLGVLLARYGKKVVLVDLDLGAANLHSFVGVPSVKTGLNRYLSKRVNDLSEVAFPTEIKNLHIISSMDCSLEIGNIFYAQKVRIVNAIQRLPFECVLLDLGAGSTFNVLDFLLASTDGVFVFTPEPTSIQNTVQFIEAAYLRRVKQILKKYTFDRLMKELAEGSEAGAVRSPMHLIEKVNREDPQRGAFLEKALERLSFKLVLNQYRKHIDETLGNKIEKVCNRHFYAGFQFLGNIAYDERVHNSVMSNAVFANKYAYTPTSSDLGKIAELMINNGKRLPHRAAKHGEI